MAHGRDLIKESIDKLGVIYSEALLGEFYQARSNHEITNMYRLYSELLLIVAHNDYLKSSGKPESQIERLEGLTIPPFLIKRPLGGDDDYKAIYSDGKCVHLLNNSIETARANYSTLFGAQALNGPETLSTPEAEAGIQARPPGDG
jgi:hypothetical protein